MDIRKVKKLIELVEESGVAEIEIKEEDGAIRISRVSQVAPPVASVSAPAPMAPAPAAPAAPVEGGEAAEDVSLENAFSSPMVGTFYAASGPGKPAFMKVGDSVKEGDVLCIIEAMKIMNQITSDRTGTVRKVLVVDSEAVEFGQPLFVID